MEEDNNLEENTRIIFDGLVDIYWRPLYQYLKKNPSLNKTFTGFLLNRTKLAFYYGKDHLAIEYFGSERVDEFTTETALAVRICNFTRNNDNFFEQIVGFKYDSTTNFPFPLPPFSEDLIMPTNKGMDKLEELNWNFEAQNSLMGFNVGNFYVPKGQFSRYVNSLFFDADENGLKTRHIKWIDFIPYKLVEIDEDSHTIEIDLGFYSSYVEQDAHYVYPIPNKSDYKFSKLPQLNRFIELAGSLKTRETDITSFLELPDNKFIMAMAFGGIGIKPQVLCEWQSEDKDALKPDFFIVEANGYANIVEFKLPHLKSKAIVNKDNRESFSAEINSYISQTRVYKIYFEDPANKRWIEDKYGFKVNNPKRILVIGRRMEFPSDIWKEIISDYKDIEIRTYDDIVDIVTAQLYL